MALCLWLGSNGVALLMVKRAQHSNIIVIIIYDYEHGHAIIECSVGHSKKFTSCHEYIGRSKRE